MMMEKIIINDSEDENGKSDNNNDGNLDDYNRDNDNGNFNEDVISDDGYKKSFQIYYKLADEGSKISLKSIEHCYDNGFDEVKEFQVHLESALVGNVDAIWDVEFCYNNGIGVCKDEKEAFEGSKKELNTARHNLGCFVENYYSNSQYMLGNCFYGRCGTRKNIAKAIYLLNKTKENGNTDANELLKEIIINKM
ncbi:hypothetical protein Glove_117g133 [Diversispora epigaea]|uniref:Uncharacterized protein n=1 Tax=Diversispora epigaea TaxID=1348612 RepID=A0A397J043_9GLOM|nr:hypothetical protein Glove_117g133 [Diversispora epigaea]